VKVELLIKTLTEMTLESRGTSDWNNVKELFHLVLFLMLLAFLISIFVGFKISLV